MVIEKVTERLSEEWSVSITSQIQADLDEQFNFYEVLPVLLPTNEA